MRAARAETEKNLMVINCGLLALREAKVVGWEEAAVVC